MPLGIALLLIFILYLIDKHNRWRQALKITAALMGLGILGAGGLFGWHEYESWQETKQEAQREAAETKQVAQKQAELAKTCKAWEDKHPDNNGGSQWEEVEDPPPGCEGPLETTYQERSGPWNDYAKTVKVPNHKQFGNGHIAPDSAILFNGGTMITTVFFGNRIKVLGEDSIRYRVQIPDGRKGELNKEEVELDKGVVISPDPN